MCIFHSEGCLRVVSFVPKNEVLLNFFAASYLYTRVTEWRCEGGHRLRSKVCLTVHGLLLFPCVAFSFPAAVIRDQPTIIGGEKFHNKVGEKKAPEFCVSSLSIHKSKKDPGSFMGQFPPRRESFFQGLPKFSWKGSSHWRCDDPFH